jgi:hypothetical protein
METNLLRVLVVKTSPLSQAAKAKPSRLRPPHGTGNLGANPANSCPLTPLGFLERAATVFGDCPSVVYHDTVFTWSQTHRRCLRLASALVSLGITRGDIVSHPPSRFPLFLLRLAVELIRRSIGLHI